MICNSVPKTQAAEASPKGRKKDLAWRQTGWPILTAGAEMALRATQIIGGNLIRYKGVNTRTQEKKPYQHFLKSIYTRDQI